MIIGRAVKALCVFLLCALVAHAEGPFVSPQSTVVLVTGLAGDLESEKGFQDQLHSWLDLLAAQVFTGKIIILSDADLDNMPPGLSIEKHKATRDEFLQLKKAAVLSTNQMLLAAWGHGGTQGRTPVFHVRGPRLTASDFKSLAENVKADSKWILFFRGSASFARELAAPNRNILSSEEETAYSSDPIAMPVLLKILSAEPATGFPAAAEALGPAIKRWYEDRNLARTEEPTLWSGQDNPRILATGNTTEQAPHTNTSTNAATGKTAILPPAWKEIRRIDAQQYPNHDAVTLRRHITYTVGDRPALSSDLEEYLQILTEEGKRFGDFDFQYSPPGEDIRFIACEVLTPNGELIKLDPDAIRETAPSGIPEFGTIRRKFFSLPHVGPGAIVHVHVQTLWASFPLPHVSTQIPLDSEIPILQETVRVSVPRGGAFHFAFENHTADDPVVKQTEYGTSYSWTLDNLPARTREALSLPRAEPRLLISTFPDWNDFAQWYARICQLSDEITPEITAKAAEITRGLNTDEEKIAAVFRYVTALRYVAVELGINSFRPHAAAAVLQNQYGDCKDKANLFNTLVRSLNLDGLSASLVLVPRFSQANEQTPGLAFNHAIARIVQRDKTYWVDTTDDVCRFGMLPPGDPGRNVLVIDGKSTTLTALPQPQARDHRVESHATLKCASNLHETASMSVRILAAGFPDYELRELTRQAKKQSVNTPLLTPRFRLDNATFIMDKQSCSQVSALNADFCLQMEGEVIGTSTAISEDRTLLRMPVWLPLEWDAALHRRTAGLFLNQGYPVQLDQTIDWEAPKGSIIAPCVHENTQGPLTWKMEWRQQGDIITSRFRAELASGEIPASDVPRFQNQLRQMLSALDAGVQCKTSFNSP